MLKRVIEYCGQLSILYKYKYQITELNLKVLMALRNEYQNQIDALQNDKKKIVDLLTFEFSQFVKVDEKNVEDAIKTIGLLINMFI